MTKPERIEVGQRWTNGTGDFATVVRLEGHLAILHWDTGDETDPTQVMLLSMLTYLGMAATPGTATVTPAGDEGRSCSTCHGVHGEPACPPGWHSASKPPAAPVYGRLVGELRAPDGTPRTALEAIQAKREPERWVPSVDEWDLLPDAGR